MSKSLSETVRQAIASARLQLVSTGTVYADSRLIQRHIAAALPRGCSVWVLSDAESGFNVCLWSPVGRRITNRKHASGYFIMPLGLKGAAK
jgi:hypothetical protein